MWSSYQSVQEREIHSGQPSKILGNSSSSVINGSNRTTNARYTPGFPSRLDRFPQKAPPKALYPSNTSYMKFQSPALLDLDLALDECSMATSPNSAFGNSLAEEYFVSRIFMNSQMNVLKPSGSSLDHVEAEAEASADRPKPKSTCRSTSNENEKRSTRNEVHLFAYFRPIRAPVARKNENPWHIGPENWACRRPSRRDFI